MSGIKWREVLLSHLFHRIHSYFFRLCQYFSIFGPSINTGHHNATSKFLFYRLDYNYKLSLRVLTKTKPGIAKRKTATSMKLLFFKPGFHMIVPVVSKKCSDDRDDHMETLPRRSQTTRTTETTSIAWIELSSIRTIGTIV